MAKKKQSKERQLSADSQRLYDNRLWVSGDGTTYTDGFANYLKGKGKVSAVNEEGMTPYIKNTSDDQLRQDLFDYEDTLRANELEQGMDNGSNAVTPTGGAEPRYDDNGAGDMSGHMDPLPKMPEMKAQAVAQSQPGIVMPQTPAPQQSQATSTPNNATNVANGGQPAQNMAPSVPNVDGNTPDYSGFSDATKAKIEAMQARQKAMGINVDTEPTARQFAQNLANIQALRAGVQPNLTAPKIENPLNNVHPTPSALEQNMEPINNAMQAGYQQQFQNGVAEQILNGGDGQPQEQTPNGWEQYLLNSLEQAQREREQLSQNDPEQQRADAARKRIANISDAISGLANLFGTIKGATPQNLTPSSSLVSQDIAQNSALRSKRIGEIDKHLTDIMRNLNDYRRNNINEMNAETRRLNYEERRDRYKRDYDFKLKKLGLDEQKFEQKCLEFDSKYNGLSKYQQMQIEQKVLDRLLREQNANTQHNDRVARQESTDAEKARKAAETERKAIDKKYDDIVGDMTKSRAIIQGFVDAGGDASLATTPLTREKLQKMAESKPEWGRANGLLSKDGSTPTPTPAPKPKDEKPKGGSAYDEFQ